MGMQEGGRLGEGEKRRYLARGKHPRILRDEGWKMRELGAHVLAGGKENSNITKLRVI